MVKTIEEMFAEYGTMPTARQQKKIIRSVIGTASVPANPRTRAGQALAERQKQAKKLLEPNTPEQLKERRREVAEQLSKADRDEKVREQRGLVPAPKEDFGHVPFFSGTRKSIGWATGFREAWFNAHTDQGQPRQWTCCRKGKANAHPNCVGTSTDMSKFQIDHKISLFEFIDKSVNVLRYCDGKHHWDVYLFGNRNDIKHPVNDYTWWLGSDNNIYRNQGDRSAPLGIALIQPVPTILEVAHWEENLQVLCSSCNERKGGQPNNGQYRPTHAGECSCEDKKCKYLGISDGTR